MKFSVPDIKKPYKLVITYRNGFGGYWTCRTVCNIRLDSRYIYVTQIKGKVKRIPLTVLKQIRIDWRYYEKLKQL